MLPTFLVIGAAKCGTSSLCQFLGEHPDVFVTEPKEIHFFGRDDPHKTLSWYEAFFAQAAGCSAVGEGSTSYTHPDIIDRCAVEIGKLIPDCRLIYMVRNPLDRLESDWKMRRHEGWSAASINDAVAQQPSLVTHGLYWSNLSVYLRHFPAEQILVVFLEDFSRDPNAELRRCFTHIRVTPDRAVEGADRPVNAASGYRKLGPIPLRIADGSVAAAVKRALPGWFVKAAKATLTRRATYTVRWEPGVREQLRERFREDSRQLLRFCGKAPDFWVEPGSG